jgi:hypothetical protein
MRRWKRLALSTPPLRQVALEGEVDAGGQLGLQERGCLRRSGLVAVLLPLAGSYSVETEGRPISEPISGERQLRVRLSRTWSRLAGSGFHSRCSKGVQTLLRWLGRWPRPSSPIVVMPSPRRPKWNAHCRPRLHSSCAKTATRRVLDWKLSPNSSSVGRPLSSVTRLSSRRASSSSAPVTRLCSAPSAPSSRRPFRLRLMRRSRASVRSSRVRSRESSARSSSRSFSFEERDAPSCPPPSSRQSPSRRRHCSMRRGPKKLDWPRLDPWWANSGVCGRLRASKVSNSPRERLRLEKKPGISTRLSPSSPRRHCNLALTFRPR